MTRGRLDGAESPWSDAAVAELRVLWADLSIPLPEIGRRLGGLTKNAVAGKAHRLGLPARPDPIQRGGPPRPPAPARPAGAVTLPPLQSLLAAPPMPCKPLPHHSAAPRLCAFVVNDARPYACCGQPVEGRSPYCPRHSADCYVGHRRPADAGQ